MLCNVRKKCELENNWINNLNGFFRQVFFVTSIDLLMNGHSLTKINLLETSAHKVMPHTAL